MRTTTPVVVSRKPVSGQAHPHSSSVDKTRIGTPSHTRFPGGATLVEVPPPFLSKNFYIKKPHHRVRRDQTRFFWIHFLIKVNSSRGQPAHHLDELLDVDAVLWIMVQHRECQAYHQSIQ